MPTKRKCKSCNRSKRPGLFSYRKTICNACYKRTPAYRAQRDRYLLATYGLTVDEYDALLEVEDGTCWICGGRSGEKHLAVDHDHKTGQVRGLLCKRCNSVLARIHNREDIADAMAVYLWYPGVRVNSTLGRTVLTPDTPRAV